MPILGPIDCDPDYISSLYGDPANELLLAEYALASGGLQLGMLTAGGANAGAGADRLLRITEGTQGGGGGGRIGCFRSYTSVRMGNNTRQPIRTVMPGNIVWAFDKDGRLWKKKVSAHYIHASFTYRRVWKDNGKFSEVTEGHPYWQWGERFTPIGLLKPWDFVLQNQGDKWRESTIIRNDDIEEQYPLLFHNLEVEDLQTYIAGDDGVHNLKSPVDPEV